MSRTTYHHGDLRAALLRAARRLLERTGPEGTSLRAIAREAGVSSAAPYHHFADREALLAALGAEGFEELGSAMRDAARRARASRPLERLQAAGVAYVRFAVRHPALFRLMFSGLLNDRTAYPQLQHAADSAFDVLRELLGKPVPGDSAAAPEPPALAAWSTVHGLAMLLIEGRLGKAPTDATAAKLARDATRVLGEGLGSYLATG